MQVITSDITVYHTDEYLCIGEETTLKGVIKFADTMIKVFGR